MRSGRTEKIDIKREGLYPYVSMRKTRNQCCRCLRSHFSSIFSRDVRTEDENPPKACSTHSFSSFPLFCLSLRGKEDGKGEDEREKFFSESVREREMEGVKFDAGSGRVEEKKKFFYPFARRGGRVGVNSADGGGGGMGEERKKRKTPLECFSHFLERCTLAVCECFISAFAQK